MRQKKQKIRMLVSVLIALSIGLGLFFFLDKSEKIVCGNREEMYASSEGYYLQSPLQMDESTVVEQTFICTTNNLSGFSLKYYLDEQAEGTLAVQLYDSSNDKVDEWIDDISELRANQSSMYSLKHRIENSYGEEYRIVILTSGYGINIWQTEMNAFNGGELWINNEQTEKDLSFSIFHEKYVIATLVYAILICVLFSIFIACFYYFYLWKWCFYKIIKFVELINKNRRMIALGMVFSALLVLVGIPIEKVLSSHSAQETEIAFNIYRYGFIVITFLCIEMLILFRKYLKKKPEVVFLSIFLLIGFLYVFALPGEAEISWDESIHFWRAVGVSHPTTGYANEAESWLYWHSGIPYNLSNGINGLHTLYDRVQEIYNMGQSAAANTNVLSQLYAVAYIPSAIMLKLGRALNFPYAVVFKMGTGINVFLYVMLIYFAMKRLKSGKMIMAVVAGSVTSFFLASVYSSDSWITGFTILGFSYFLACMQEKTQLKNKDLFIMLLSFMLAYMPKGIYFPLFLIFTLLPSSRFKSKKQYRYFMSACVAFMAALASDVVLASIWSLPIWIVVFLLANLIGKVLQQFSVRKKIIFWITSCIVIAAMALAVICVVLPKVLGIGDLRGGTDVNAVQQIYYILENPIEYIKMLYQFLTGHYLSFKTTWNIIFTTFGYIGRTNIEMWALTLLLIVAVTDKREADDWKGYRVKGAGIYLILALIVVMMASALYIEFTPVALNTVLGLQPRYLFPLIFPFFAMLGSCKIRNYINQGIYNGSVIAGTAGILLYSIWNVVVRMYY